MGFWKRDWEVMNFSGWRNLIQSNANFQVALLEKVIEEAVRSERKRCAKIAREQFLVTPNGRDCGEFIAQEIEKG